MAEHEAGNSPRDARTIENQAILRIALIQGALDADGLSAAISLIAENPDRPAGLLMVEAGLVDRGTMEAICDRLEPAILKCPQCGADAVGPAKGRGTPCVACGTAMEYETMFEPCAAPVKSGIEAERYAIGEEIGRGGLGRVMVARDRVLGREVAIKEMISGVENEELLQRFLREGEIAGRMMHPNIVPIFDVGVREQQGPGAGGAGFKVPYFAMGRIRGMDLRQILAAVERGAWGSDERTAVRDGKHDAGPIAADMDPRKEFSRPRLLRIFQDVCLAVAYAHDQGVIHRDLKPANVMVGGFGEVYVVDWGLAKVTREPDSPDCAARLVDSPDRNAPDQGNQPGSRERQDNLVDRGLLTHDGAVVGTPAYMPPEQAEGRIDEVDERSDIYSLGAILYEILTLRPPFDGPTGMSVIQMVLNTELKPPSSMITDARRTILSGAASGQGVPVGDQGGACAPSAGAPQARPERLQSDFPEDVPPDLERLVLKAMSRSKSRRYSSALKIHDEIQAFLDGEKERERNRQRALAKVAEGEIHTGMMEKLRAQRATLDREIEVASAAIRQCWPVEKKAGLWSMQDRSREFGRKIVDLFTDAANAFQSALEFERGNKEARAALADLYWAQFLREEEASKVDETRRYENLVKKYNDGQYDARLRGDGTLAVTTNRFTCACLREGRLAGPDELMSSVDLVYPAAAASAVTPAQVPENAERPEYDATVSFHLFSGRAADNHKGAEGLPELEPKAPVRFRAHGRDCRTAPLDGVDVWLFRLEEKNKILVPAFPVLPDSPDAAARQTDSTDKREIALPDGEEGANQCGAPWRPWSPGLPPKRVLDRLYDPGSPFRPTEGMYLGRTPINAFAIPMGSYLMIFDLPHQGTRGRTPCPHHPPQRLKTGAGSGLGSVHDQDNQSPVKPDQDLQALAPLRVPVFVGRNAVESVDVTMYGMSEIPEGFLQVPAGNFIYQSEQRDPVSLFRRKMRVEEFFVAKFPVTCREYAEFLNELSDRDPDQALRRSPRKTPTAGFYWPRNAVGKFKIPTDDLMSGASGTFLDPASRPEWVASWWKEDWPVVGVSWEDLMAYAAWRSLSTGYVISLQNSYKWQKAALGTDGRKFPFGDDFDATFMNSAGSHESGSRPEAVDSFPVDESPCGARGMGGNTSDRCLDNPGVRMPHLRMVKGGRFTTSGSSGPITSTSATPVTDVTSAIGGRLCLVPRIAAR